MALGRIVILDTGYQSVTVAQDLVEIKLGSGQFAFVHSVKVTQTSDATSAEAELLPINLKRASGSYTSGFGSSGAGSSSLTVVKGGTNDAVHGLALIERNNTTQAVAGSGALETFHRGSFCVISGEWESSPTPIPMSQLLPSEALVVSLDAAPADALTLACVVTLEVFG